MITFKPVVISSNRHKDGSFPLKIRVYFNANKRNLPTSLVCQPADLTRTLKIKNPTLLAKADVLIREMREALADLSPFDLEGKDVDFVVNKIREHMTNEGFRLDFFDFGYKVAESKGPRTGSGYVTALNTLQRFRGGYPLDVNDITRSMLLEFIEFVEAEPKVYKDPHTGLYKPSAKAKIPKGAASRHIMKLGHIFAEAKKRYNDEDEGRILIPRSPFAGIEKTFPPPKGQRCLEPEIIQSIIDAEPANEAEGVALSLFVVSFGLMGANLADLYAAKKPGKTWIYNRIKTQTRRADRAEMRVDIPDELTPYLERLKGMGGYWLNLHEYASTPDAATQRVNRHLRAWAKRNNVPEFTFYAARHSFATLGRRIGIEKATIDDCLNHKGDYAMADIYIEKSWSLMQEANRKVLALFKWDLH